MLNIFGNEGHEEALKKSREHIPTTEKTDIPVNNVTLNATAVLPEPEEVFDQMRREGKLPPKSIMENIEKLRANSSEEFTANVKKNKNN